MALFQREDILAKLRAKVADGKPIVGGGAGTGISAKLSEAGGIDLLVIYNSGRFRMGGRGSLSGMMPYGDANAIVMDMAREVIPVARQTPVLAGVCGTDPFRVMKLFLREVDRAGFSGVQNFPTVGLIDGTYRAGLEETGMGYGLEVDMIRTAREMGLFTIVYVFNAEESRAMAEAGADVIIAHCSTTVGGSIGVGTAMSLDDAAELVQIVIDAGRAVSSDTLFLSHGGPVATPADAAYINEHTDAVGFVGASSLERFATEASVEALTREFKAIPLERRQ